MPHGSPRWESAENWPWWFLVWFMPVLQATTGRARAKSTASVPSSRERRRACPLGLQRRREWFIWMPRPALDRPPVREVLARRDGGLALLTAVSGVIRPIAMACRDGLLLLRDGRPTWVAVRSLRLVALESKRPRSIPLREQA